MPTEMEDGGRPGERSKMVRATAAAEFPHVIRHFRTEPQALGADFAAEDDVSIETSQMDPGTEMLVRQPDTTAEPASGRAEHDEEFPLELRPTTLAELCRSAVDDVTTRFPDRTVEYAPDGELEGAGEWDPRRITYAVTILLEDALKRTGPGERVTLRWREHDGVVVLRVEYPRPLDRGDRFVTYFEDGVRPDGADDTVGTLRLVVARKIMLQHRGHLARIRTRAGTTYVVTLPRSPATDALAADGADAI